MRGGGLLVRAPDGTKFAGAIEQRGGVPRFGDAKAAVMKRHSIRAAKVCHAQERRAGIRLRRRAQIEMRVEIYDADAWRRGFRFQEICQSPERAISDFVAAAEADRK